MDAPPASDWRAPRPAGLMPQLWAKVRPTPSTLADLRLPPGKVVYGAGGHLLGWRSAPDSVLDLSELWLYCARRFPQTGLWPICDSRSALKPGRSWHRTRTDDDRPYWQDPYAVPSDVYDAAYTADRWGYFNDPDEPGFHQKLLSDFGLTDTSMVLAEASAPPEDPLRALVAPEAAESLTLVACRRPADAILLLDFGVPNDHATPGIFTGVLRSWETRFGVVPVMLDQAWTAFQVLAPPTERTQIDRLASEVFSFAVDTALQGGFHHRTMDREVGARDMVQRSEWLIWWD